MSDINLSEHAIVLAFALLVTGIIQIGCVRFSRSTIGVVSSLFVGFVLGFIGLLSGEFFLASSGTGGLVDSICLGISNAVLFVCSWYFYFHYINIGEASLRIRILREIDAVEGCTPQQLFCVYNTRVIVETRMKRLVADGQLIHRQGRYYAGKARMVLVAKVFTALRWVLLGRASAY